MNKLKMIDGVVLLAEALLGLMIIGAIVLIVVAPQDKYFDIDDPHWEITSETVRETLRKNLPPPEQPMKLTPESVEMSFPLSGWNKVMLIAQLLALSAYLIYILDLTRKIIGNVKDGAPFNQKNIGRVKLLGLLISIPPVVEWLLKGVVIAWIEMNYSFAGLELVSTSTLGWSVLIPGLLIMVLGVAFEQGQKIQEENELTV